MKVLFVCGANIIRSPLAERLLNDKAGFIAKSAGIMNGASTTLEDQKPCECCKSKLNPENHKPKLLTLELIEWSDIVLGMSDDHIEDMIGYYGENTKYALLSTTSIPSVSYNTKDESQDEEQWWTDFIQELSDAVDVFALENK